MLIPAEGAKVYYQRAVRGNERWRKVKKGYAVDLADPFLNVLDGAVHIVRLFLSHRANLPITYY